VLDDRKLEVLRAIVEDFVSTNEPVGSRALAERHGLGVSPATVRNDMAALEDEGYITHPHTSAGRIPTDRGYRLFVDRLSSVKPLSSPERRAIQSFLEGAVDLDDVVRRTVRLLGAKLVDVPDALSDLPDAAPAGIRPVLASLMAVVLETLVERPEERIALAGTANLTRHALDFPLTLRPVLEALEEQVVLLKLIGEANDPTTVHVKIGEENSVEGLRSTSVVTVGYGPEAGAYAGLGVLGPTRMDYPGAMTQVRAVARYVGELLAGS